MGEVLTRGAFVKKHLLGEYGFLSRVDAADLDALIASERADARRQALEEYWVFSRCSCGDDIACESCVSFWTISAE